MRIINTICFLFISIFANADIPRVDALKVSLDGEIYYTMVCLEGLEFREGCVFDYKNHYVCEQADYFAKRYDGIHLFSDLIVLPYSKFWPQNSRSYEEEGSLHKILIEAGIEREITKEEAMEIQVLDLVIGESAGRIHSPSLSISDISWINDYALESITSTGDLEICDIELFAIKGNVSKAEASLIKSRLNLAYKKRDNDIGVSKTEYNETVEEIYEELLIRNILMLGFCSC